jgi:hypothetical protein
MSNKKQTAEKIHLGIRPAHDLGGKVITRIHQSEFNTFLITIEKSQKLDVIRLDFETAIRIGFINPQALSNYFK